MKRLKSKLLSDPNTTTYKQIYEGSMIVDDPAHPSMLPYTDYNATYYSDSIGFEITATHKLAQDKPTVTISIPSERLGLERIDKSLERVIADFYCNTKTTR